MFRHDFHSIGVCGHKRNFTWYHGKKKKLKSVRDWCHLCERKVKYKIGFYIKPVIELPKEKT